MFSENRRDIRISYGWYCLVHLLTFRSQLRSSSDGLLQVDGCPAWYNPQPSVLCGFIIGSCRWNLLLICFSGSNEKMTVRPSEMRALLRRCRPVKLVISNRSNSRDTIASPTTSMSQELRRGDLVVDSSIVMMYGKRSTTREAVESVSLASKAVFCWVDVSARATIPSCLKILRRGSV